MESSININQNLTKKTNEQTNFCICKNGYYQLNSSSFETSAWNQYKSHRHMAKHLYEMSGKIDSKHVGTSLHKGTCIIVSMYTESEQLLKVRGSLQHTYLLSWLLHNLWENKGRRKKLECRRQRPVKAVYIHWIPHSLTPHNLLVLQGTKWNTNCLFHLCHPLKDHLTRWKLKVTKPIWKIKASSLSSNWCWQQEPL